MKLSIIVVLVALVVAPLAVHATDVTCSVPSVKIASDDTHAQKIAKIKDAFTNYRKHIPSFMSAKTGRYEICFDMTDAVELKAGDIGKDDVSVFTLMTNPIDKREIVIVGLKLKKADDLVLGDKPVIRLIADPGTKTMLKNVSILNAANGLKVIGSGEVELEQSQIAVDSPYEKVKEDDDSMILLPENRTSSGGVGMPLS